jgi:tetratricopeptide (TPR) repeat protein
VAALNRSLALAPDSVETHLFLALSLLFSGNPEGAKQSLSTLPAGIDPQGLVSFIRFALAMAAHQPDEALAALAKAPESYVDPADNTSLPSTLLRAQALAMKGETAPAHAAFEEARLVLEKRLSEQRDSAEIQIHLAAVYAGLGQKTAALAAGRRAIELMPLTKDLIGGISCLGQFAQIEAQVGESQSAIDHLEQLMALPAGFDVSTASLRLDPTWNPLRQEARFQKLIAKYEAASLSLPPHAEGKP